MFKSVLIISDNYFLSEKVLEIINRKNMTGCNFSFSISPFSNKNDFKFLREENIKIFDLRNQSHTDFIKNNYDLIFSIHCKQIFPSDLIDEVKCINIHPGYNPINRGWYPQVFSIINKLPVGATIHEIDEKLDHGGIIARELVEKQSFDTSESLYKRIINKEIELLDLNFESIINGDYKIVTPEEEGNLFLKKDFNNLLKLNLEEQTSVGELIDKLRALTHGKFNNAYFIDEETGKKIYVGIILNPEKDE